MTVSAEEALRRLEEGNRRFLEMPSGSGQPRPAGGGFRDLSSGQAPFAAVLGCSDSRVPVETIFSQGPGDLFVIRVGGNVVGPASVASLEFAVEELRVGLVLVLGHTHCAMVTAALTPAQKRKKWMTSRNLEAITGRISRFLERGGGGQSPGFGLHLDDAVRINVEAACENLPVQSSLLAAKARAGRISIVGSVYDLATGRVEFLDSKTP